MVKQLINWVCDSCSKTVELCFKVVDTVVDYTQNCVCSVSDFCFDCVHTVVDKCNDFVVLFINTCKESVNHVYGCAELALSHCLDVVSSFLKKK